MKFYMALSRPHLSIRTVGEGLRPNSQSDYNPIVSSLKSLQDSAEKSIIQASLNVTL